MRLLIPTDAAPAPHAPVARHFGRAPYFAVVDTVSGAIGSLSVPGAHSACGSLITALLGSGVQAVACRGLGAGALASLTASGIPVYTAEGADVAAVAGAFASAELPFFDRDGTCGGGMHECEER